MRNWLHNGFTRLGVALTAVLLLAGVGLVPQQAAARSSPTSSAPVTINIWLTSTVPSLTTGIPEFEKLHPNIKVSTDIIQGSTYSTKLDLGMKSSSPPNLFETWGGGLNFANFLPSHLIVNLSNIYPQLQKNYLPTVLAPIESGGQVYAVPFTGIQPDVFFYNKQAFSQAGIQSPPTTWTQLLSDISALKKHNIIPIAQGSETWTEMMWPQYLAARLGGKAFWTPVIGEKANAWSSQSMTSALNYTEKLIHQNPFEPGYQGIQYANGEPTKMVATGQAAMELMGAWELGNFQTETPGFASGTNMGYFAFPSVPGDGANKDTVAGNPATYLGLASHAPNREQTEEFLQFMLSKQFSNILLQQGTPPGTTSAASDISRTKLNPVIKRWDEFAWNLTKAAPYFQQSWDQALPPGISTEMTTDVGKVFAGSMSPQQFSSDLDAQESNAG